METEPSAKRLLSLMIARGQSLHVSLADSPQKAGSLSKAIQASRFATSCPLRHLCWQRVPISNQRQDCTIARRAIQSAGQSTYVHLVHGNASALASHSATNLAFQKSQPHWNFHVHTASFHQVNSSHANNYKRRISQRSLASIEDLMVPLQSVRTFPTFFVDSSRIHTLDLSHLAEKVSIQAEQQHSWLVPDATEPPFPYITVAFSRFK